MPKAHEVLFSALLAENAKLKADLHEAKEEAYKDMALFVQHLGERASENMELKAENEKLKAKNEKLKADLQDALEEAPNEMVLCHLPKIEKLACENDELKAENEKLGLA